MRHMSGVVDTVSIYEEIENQQTLYLLPHMSLHADGQLGWLSSC